MEHPHPTDATAKLLYAHAFQCAYPGCEEYLYREDERSGNWVLNSRICHICARSEGGPRWDPEQTAEDNRRHDNLLIMCTAHASAIDDPNSLSSYSVDMLLEWKAAQIADHQQRKAGWQLSSSMAKEVVGVSFSNVAVAINDSVLHLGGEGGRGPGSGGGGGGAIGPGARAGRGGDGGRITDQDGNPLTEEDLATFLRSTPTVDPPPGAGGAGAGAMGQDAVGADGGSGGDGMRGTVAVEPGDICEIKVGKGGKAGRLPGQHGESGEDSSLIVRSPDGKIKHVFRVRGGAAAKSGTLPEDWLTVSRADIENGFQITTLFAATGVEFHNGLMFVLGGGWTKINVAALPCDTILNVAVVATWRKLSAENIRGIQLCLSNPVGEEVSRLALALPASASNETSFTWISGLGAPLDREGAWTISVISGEFIFAQVDIAVTNKQ